MNVCDKRGGINSSLTLSRGVLTEQRQRVTFERKEKRNVSLGLDGSSCSPYLASVLKQLLFLPCQPSHNTACNAACSCCKEKAQRVPSKCCIHHVNINLPCALSTCLLLSTLCFPCNMLSLPYYSFRACQSFKYFQGWLEETELL